MIIKLRNNITRVPLINIFHLAPETGKREGNVSRKADLPVNIPSSGK